MGGGEDGEEGEFGRDGTEREREEKMSHDECEKLMFDDDDTAPREDLKQRHELEQRASD